MINIIAILGFIIIAVLAAITLIGLFVAEPRPAKPQSRKELEGYIARLDWLRREGRISKDVHDDERSRAAELLRMV